MNNQWSCIHRSREIIKRINVEPVCFLYSMFIALFYNTQAEFFFFKCCVDTFSSRLNDDVVGFCLNITKNNNTDDFNSIESRTATFLQYNTIVLNVPGILVSLIIGSISDRVGRKLPLILALTDSLLGSMVSTFVAVFPQTSILAILTGSGLGSMLGGSMVVFMLVFSSVRDINKDPQDYSVHLAVTTSVCALGFVAGSLGSGLLISRLSYAQVFLSAQVVMAAAIFSAICFMRETYRLPNDMDDLASNRRNRSTPPGQLRQPITFQSVWDTIGINKVFHTVFQPRTNRKSLLIAIVTFQFVLMADMGLTSLILPYAKYPPLLWPDKYYGYFNAVSFGLAAVGMPFWTFVLKKPFDLADTTMITFALVFASLKLAAYSVSKTTLEMFAAGSLTFFSQLYFPYFRSLVSGMVSREETGKIYSVISISESAAPLVSSLVFNNIFLATLKIFTGFVFAIAACILFICALVIIYVHFALKRSQSDEVPFLTQDSTVSDLDEEICDA